jgi:Histidine kinase-, DNA gyrase B-, and HSP90-like ATPase
VRELALHVLDILQNTVEAGASRVTLTIHEDVPADRLTITVADNGRGMDAATVTRVTDPFYTTRTTRHVGLGLPLYAMAAEHAGGWLRIASQPESGTTIEAAFQLSHPDRQPLGDMSGTLLAFLLSERTPELYYEHRLSNTAQIDDRTFEFDTAEIRAVLAGVPFTHPVVAQWMAEYLEEGEDALRED